MTATRTLALVLGLALSAQTLLAQDRSRYREFQLGSDLRSVAALAKVPASEAKTIHQRPAVIQELEWRPPYFVGGSTAVQREPVQRILFSFYDDQLFRLAINYDRQRTDGMTASDMIDAISEAYGPALLPRLNTSQGEASQIEAESGQPVAHWGDTDDYSVALYRSSYASEFRVIVTSPRLEALARTAIAQAVRLDEQEAPQRELARQKQAADDTRASQEKARTANKAAFRP
jgi:hypothetical protein